MSKKNQQRKRQELSRRSLIKWTLGTTAALGLAPWRAFEVLEDTGGSALAQSAACTATARSVHIVAGNGGFAWFQLLWPHVDIAAAQNNNFAFHAPGQHTMAQGTDRPLALGPEAPFQGLDGSLQMTALMAGNNETHTQQPRSSSTIAAGTSVFAAAASMQAVNPTLIPVISVDNVPFGTATGAPNDSRVPGADDIVGLFNSAVSRAGQLLENTDDAELYQATLRTLLTLNPSAGQARVEEAFRTGKGAAGLIGTNLASQLQVTNGDLQRYGISNASPTRLQEFAKTLIVTAKAMSLGLTSSVVMPAFRDDPHGAFNDMNNLRNTVSTIGQSMQAFYDDLAALDDPTCAGKLSDNIVMSIHGDTPKDPRNRGGWPDGTPGNSNWVYVFSSGMLRTGWFGGINRNGNVTGWDPTTGNDANINTGQLAGPASAAIGYAVARGDMRRVEEFYRGPDISGVIRPVTM